MAHFAKISDTTDIVENVIVIANEDCGGGDFPQSEPIGQNFINNVLGLEGTWIQTSYNGNFRNMFAHRGGKYMRDIDSFVQEQPFPSWTLGEDLLWNPPIPFPNDGKAYAWDEPSRTWVEMYEDMASQINPV